MIDVEEIIDERLTRMLGLQNRMIASRKRKLGLVANEFDRGQMVQMLKDDGIELAESRKLEHHIDKFLEYQQRRIAPNPKRQSIAKITKKCNRTEVADESLPLLCGFWYNSSR